MYIEKFHKSNRSFSKGSAHQSNTNQLKQLKSNRLNNSLNKISQYDKDDKALKDLQNSLIGQYDHFELQEIQNKNINESNLRQLFYSQNARGKSDSIQKPAKPPLDNSKTSKEKQRLQQIYTNLNSKGHRRIDQKQHNIKQDTKQNTHEHEIQKHNLNQEQQIKQQLNLNLQNDKKYCFYDASYYQNYIRNSPQDFDGKNSSQNSSFYSQMGGKSNQQDEQAQVVVDSIQADNLNNIKTITSSNNISKQDITTLNPSFYNNKQKFISKFQNQSQNQNSQVINQSNLQKHAVTQDQIQQQQSAYKQSTQHSSNNHMLTQSTDQSKQIKNISLLKLEQAQQKNDPLAQIDELKQIMMIEQQNISKILNKGNQVLQPKLTNSSIKEQKTSFYKKSDISISDINKEGLLGAYEEYNKLSKHEIIEKLLVSEHIMKQLYKKTKQYQELILQISQQKQEEQSQK
ncbi:hypothetical protein TTHERM_00052270 (macronuclear) [Tetrahymena thermophila SB210]|uniref:Uncharacterized protein n=1 Tax=Tetrahymena thermophila (strain SB210) TaxID=312017 RepID=Q23CW3_TETTS|nr:hypothetical protein TTHERM_00052270 [Tetrahymena thermophila SB210]EAR94357.1 hypothetical protein TTHERM_00052270 [Tetrahymena thermophila SB210]|eukprot:XP_001014923.1 hypothetical protein TTHERM_00052270 [Tetrahymena thermophila SB210]